MGPIQSQMSPEFRAKVNELLTHHYCITLDDIGYPDDEEALLETMFASPDELVEYVGRRDDLINFGEILGRCDWGRCDWQKRLRNRNSDK